LFQTFQGQVSADGFGRYLSKFSEISLANVYRPYLLTTVWFSFYWKSKRQTS